MEIREIGYEVARFYELMVMKVEIEKTGFKGDLDSELGDWHWKIFPTGTAELKRGECLPGKIKILIFAMLNTRW